MSLLDMSHWTLERVGQPDSLCWTWKDSLCWTLETKPDSLCWKPPSSSSSPPSVVHHCLKLSEANLDKLSFWKINSKFSTKKRLKIGNCQTLPSPSRSASRIISSTSSLWGQRLKYLFAWWREKNFFTNNQKTSFFPFKHVFQNSFSKLPQNCCCDRKPRKSLSEGWHHVV